LRSLVKSPTIRANVWIAFFVLFGNSVESIPEGYKRYLVNGLRETFGLIGVPIRLSMR
jgi:predicted GTPase